MNTITFEKASEVDQLKVSWWDYAECFMGVNLTWRIFNQV